MVLKIKRYNDHLEKWEECELKDVCIVDYMFSINGKYVEFEELIFKLKNGDEK